MKRHVARRAQGYMLIAAAALITAVWSGRPEAVALAAVPLTLLAAGVLLAKAPELSLAAAFDKDIALEGEQVTLALTLTAGRCRARDVELHPALPAWLPAAASADPPCAFSLAARERHTLTLELCAARWGACNLNAVELRCFAPLRVFSFTGVFAAQASVRVYPRRSSVRRLIDPAHRSLLVGSRVSRARGSGIEFAEIRAFQRGDRVRRVNWRVSARRRMLYVNDQHPDRNADVILLLDSFQDVEGDAGSTLDLGVRAAAALAGGYLALRDRVGLLELGGALAWLTPASGERAIYRIIDTLVRTHTAFTYTSRTLDQIPRRLLPAGALVVALTPLLDTRMTRALFDLRARGYDVAVIDCDPAALLAPPHGDTELLARRLWALEHASLKRALRAAGVQTATFTPDRPLALPLAEVIALRRHIGTPRAS